MAVANTLNALNTYTSRLSNAKSTATATAQATTQATPHTIDRQRQEQQHQHQQPEQHQPTTLINHPTNCCYAKLLIDRTPSPAGRTITTNKQSTKQAVKPSTNANLEEQQRRSKSVSSVQNTLVATFAPQTSNRFPHAALARTTRATCPFQ